MTAGVPTLPYSSASVSLRRPSSSKLPSHQKKLHNVLRIVTSVLTRSLRRSVFSTTDAHAAGTGLALTHFRLREHLLVSTLTRYLIVSSSAVQGSCGGKHAGMISGLRSPMVTHLMRLRTSAFSQFNGGSPSMPPSPSYRWSPPPALSHQSTSRMRGTLPTPDCS